MIMVSKGARTAKGAPDLGEYGLLRTVSAPRKGHLSGEGYKESARGCGSRAGLVGQVVEDPDWEYGAFGTNTATGQIQWLDARHRTQARVEDRVKQFKSCGARNLPSIDYDRNAAWLQLAASATSLTAWLRHLALDGDLAKSAV